MRGNCTICTDFFASDQNISVTFCGHVFHEECLSQWFLQCKPRKTCPQCRTKLNTNQVVPKIYMNTQECNEDELDPFQLKNELQEYQSREIKLKSDKQNLKSCLKTTKKENEDFKIQIKTLRKDLDSSHENYELLKYRLAILESELQGVRQAEKELLQLREKLALCEKTERILTVGKSEVSEMMKRFVKPSGNVSPGDLKEVATFCVSLKQEYEAMKSSRDNAKSEGMKLKKSNQSLTQRLMANKSEIEALKRSEEQLVDENSGLRKKLDVLQKAIASPSETKASTISRLLQESPAPLYITPETPRAVSKLTNVKRTMNLTTATTSAVSAKRPKLVSTPLNDDLVASSSNRDVENLKNIERDSKQHKNNRLRNHGVKENSTTSAYKLPGEINMKLITPSTSVKSSEMGSMFLPPMSSGLLHRKRLGNGSLTKRVNKVRMSATAKPFMSKPVPSASLRPTVNLVKKSCPR